MSERDDVELDPGETLDARIASCLAVLKRPGLTAKDRKTVQKMLTCAQARKQKEEGRTMSSIMTKYGVPQPSEIVDIEDSPTTGKKSKKTASPKSAPKSKKPRIETTTPKTAKVKTAPSKVKGPPTKRKADEVSLDALADDSDEEVEVVSTYEPSSDSGDETDTIATPASKGSKAKKGRPPTKRSKVGPGRRLTWCSSESDAESKARGGITFTDDELAAMYETAQDDP